MAVYEDKERGTWYFITRINGKQVKRRGFKTQKAALLAEAKMEEEGVAEKIITFELVATEYLDWYKKRRKASSYRKTSGIVRNHLIPFFKKKELRNIRQRDIISFQDKLLDSKASASYVKKIHSILSAVFNFAIKNEYITVNPARIVGNVDLKERKHINYWTLDEFKAFIKHVDDEMYYALFMTLYYSGMRRGELLALTWGDIDFENNTININKTVEDKEVTSTKTAASTRVIMMPNHTMKLLQQLKMKLKEPKMTHSVFSKNGINHISRSTLVKYYDHYVKIAGVKRIRIHDFRHSHASYLINKNYIPKMIADRLGHADVSVTLNTYSHLYPSTEKEAVKDMENDFKPAQVVEFKRKKTE